MIIKKLFFITIICISLIPVTIKSTCFPNNGTRLWDNVFNDLLIDITILSKVCVATSDLSILDSTLSSIDALSGSLTTITSYVADIDSRLAPIESTASNLYTFVNGTINSELDIIENSNLSIQSTVQVIDTRTSSIYSLDQSTSSKIDSDIALEQSILSKLMIIDSKSSGISASCSGIAQILATEQSILSTVQVIDTRTSSIYSTDQTILSYVQDIDQRTLTIESTIINLDNFVHTTINSKLDLIENNNLSIQSSVNVIDTRTTSIYSLDQAISSKVANDIVIDQNTESVLNIISSKLNNINCSQLAQILQTDQTILSKINVIDTRTSAIQSNLGNVYSIDQNIASKVNNLFTLDSSISSKLDVNISIEKSIQSIVTIIDSKVHSLNSSNYCSNIGSIGQIITIDQSILSTLNVIDTRTSSIQSNINSVYGLTRTISSKLDTDAPLQSSVNVLDTNVNTVQSYVNNIVTVDRQIASAVANLSFCCTNTTSTNPILASIFGTEIMENTLDYISIQFQYGIPNYTTTPYTQGGGTVTSANSMAILSTAGAANSIAQLQTDNTIVYRSGHEAYALFTVAFTGSFAATSSQFIGPIDYQNGFAVGFDGTTFGVTQRTNTVNTFTPQSQFNGDKLNGTGASGFTYNPALLNVFRIRYGYLGGTVILFQIMTTNGAWITFHTIQYPNTASTPSIFQPFLPITARVENLAGTSGLQLQTASWNGGIIGQPNNSSYRYYSYSARTTMNSGTNYVFTIRNKTAFNNKPNVIKIRLTGFGGYTTVDATTDGQIYTVIKNGTVTGTTFTDFSAGNSVLEVSTAGTYTAGTGTTVYLSQMLHAATVGLYNIPADSYNISIMPGETLTVIISSTAATASLFTAITWEEQF